MLLNFCDASGTCATAVALIGGNGTGKTRLSQFVRACYTAIVRDETCSKRPVFDADAVGFVEFEGAKGVTSVRIEAGRATVTGERCEATIDAGTVNGGMLLYDTQMLRMHMPADATNIVAIRNRFVLKDLYVGRVRNSVIWIDDFDLGLDALNAGDFWRCVWRRSREFDNQLVCLALRSEAFVGLSSLALHVLPPTSVRVMNELHADVMRLRQT